MRFNRLAAALCAAAAIIAAMLTIGSQADAISGGEQTSQSWFVEIEWRLTKAETTDGAKVQLCSGALVAPQWVVTAAHCFRAPSATPTTGRQTLTTNYRNIDAYVGYRGDRGKAKGTRFAIDNIVTVPSGFRVEIFNGASRNVDDIALVHLSSPTSNAVLWVAPSAEAVADNLPVQLYGAGLTRPNDLTSRDGLLRTPRGHFRTDESCGVWPGGFGVAPAEIGAVCLLEQPFLGSEVFEGDSGGPWVTDVDGNPVLVAVESAGGRVTSSDAVVHYGSTLGLKGSGSVRSWLRNQLGLADVSPGTIVRDPSSAEAWLIDDTGYRRPIPDGGTYLCLVARGATVLNLPTSQLRLLPARTATQASCSNERILVVHGSDVHQVSPTVVSTLTAAGYDTTAAAALPADLSPYDQIWYVSAHDARPAEEIDRIVAFVQSGRSLYLTGERFAPTDEVNYSTGIIANRLIRTGPIEVGGDVCLCALDAAINSTSPDDLDARPNALTTLRLNQPGYLRNVPQANVVASLPDTGEIVVAAWAPADVAGSGRLVVVMDISYLVDKDASMAPALENFANFLGR